MNFEILVHQFVQKRLGLIELVVDLVWRIVKKPHLPNFKRMWLMELWLKIGSHLLELHLQVSSHLYFLHCIPEPELTFL